MLANISLIGESSYMENISITEDWVYRLVGLTELCVAILGTPLNASVLWAACNKQKGMTMKSRRTITECLVISMSLADLIFSAFHAPFSFAYFYFGVLLNTWQCHFFYTVTHVSTIASSLSLLWLNVNKFLQLHRPLHYFLYMTKRRALIFILIGWSISIGWGVFFAFGPFVKYDELCNASLQYTEVYIFFAMEFFLLPTIVSLFVSIDVAFLVLGEKKRRFRENFLRLSRVNRGQRRSPHEQIHQNQQQNLISTSNENKRKNTRDPGNIRRITFVFATTVWSALTVLPYRFAYIIHNLPWYKYKGTEIGISVSFCFFALMALNAAGNPVITLLTHKHYANQIYGRFKWVLRKENGRNEVRIKRVSN